MPTSTTTVHRFQSLNESLSEKGNPHMATEPIRPLEVVRKAQNEFSKDQRDFPASDPPISKRGITFAAQDKLPKLPIPDLSKTIKRYLAALKPIQTAREHAETKQAAEEFLKNDGPDLQEKLKKYASDKTSYIEQFCESIDSYAKHATDNLRVRLIPQF